MPAGEARFPFGTRRAGLLSLLELEKTMMHSIPFTRKGRNVMHGFIADVKGDLNPGLPCLLESQDGTFLGHGVSLCTGSEARCFRKGVAVKVRDGIGE